jgi:hypothetical protein
LFPLPPILRPENLLFTLLLKKDGWKISFREKTNTYPLEKLVCFLRLHIPKAERKGLCLSHYNFHLGGT